MKLICRLLILVAMLLGVYMALLATLMVLTLLDRPDEWLGGVSIDATIAWLAILVLGFGFVLVETLLALPGLIWGPRKRWVALWLLVIPGYLGLLLSIGAGVLLGLVQPDWQLYIAYAVAMGIPPLIYIFTGTSFRRGNPKVAPVRQPAAVTEP